MSSSDAEQPDLRDVLFTSSQTGTIVYLDSSQVKPEEATSLPCVKTASVPPSGSAEFESVALDSTCSAPMHVVLNPVGGHGEARRYYSAVVEPILAQIPSRRVLLHETQAEGDGRRIGQLLCQENELHLVVIGGDGTVGEVLNGLMLGSNGETLRAGNAELCIMYVSTAYSLDLLTRNLAVRKVPPTRSTTPSSARARTSSQPWLPCFRSSRFCAGRRTVVNYHSTSLSTSVITLVPHCRHGNVSSLPSSRPPHCMLPCCTTLKHCAPQCRGWIGSKSRHSRMYRVGAKARLSSQATSSAMIRRVKPLCGAQPAKVQL